VTRGAWPVADENGLRGMLSAAELAASLQSGRNNEAIGTLVPAPDARARLTAGNFPHVHADHSLDLAMRRLSLTGLTVLPVVSRANVRELRGTISLQDILTAYGMSKPPEIGPRR
jgi:CBS domain-containing protein